ncbi:parallel beta-helix repeat-containing protein [Thiorhodovibrio winogradskyi]|uniref:Parallel beta-helix repeat-containing protein n=1 Tax=Thiorhodovibrio winogradskyi TaxID=77007 RepID=A0ABZ0SB74_9GAMM|nr:hypothetical protein [Thiorhodovibrio winogradskyi]
MIQDLTPFRQADNNLTQHVEQPFLVIWLTILIALFSGGYPLSAMAVCTREVIPLGVNPATTVQTVNELRQALGEANRSGNRTIFLRPGTYQVDRAFEVKGDGITIRGQTALRSDVKLLGRGMDKGPSHIFAITGNGVTLADFTAGKVSNHVVQVHGERGVEDFRMHNVHLLDAREQLLKVSYNQAKPSQFATRGVVEWCRFEFTEGYTYQGYAGGISAIGTKDWVVRDSEFNGIRGPNNEATGPAILFWQGNGNALIERNIITNSDRGIQVGLGKQGNKGGGTVVNNMVSTVTDVGIGVENAKNVNIFHNTVRSMNYPNSIEYRFPGTSGTQIFNNLVDRRIKARDQGAGVVSGNLRYGGDTWFFANADEGDFRLVAGPENLVNSGIALTDVTSDIDCEPRPSGDLPDIGADEVHSGAVPGLLIESPGMVAAWSEDIQATLPSIKARIGSKWRAKKKTLLLVLIGMTETGLVFLFLFLWVRCRRRLKKH